MRKTPTVCLLLFLSTLALGQTYDHYVAAQPELAPPMGGPAFGAPTIIFPFQPGGLFLQGGYTTTIGWSYLPLLVTPIASLSGIPTSPNLQVGITNSLIDNSLDVPVSTVPVVMESIQSNVVPQFAPLLSVPEARRFAGPGVDLGAAHFDVVSTRWSAEARSPAEVAQEMRKQPKPASVRTFTNADVQQLKNKPLTPQNPPQR